MNRLALLRGLLLTCSLTLASCVTEVFSSPVTLSTKASAARHAESLGAVSHSYTNSQIVVIPIIPNPRRPYDSLLEQARQKGGNAVVDVQLRNDNWFYALLFLFDTWELAGTAATIK